MLFGKTKAPEISKIGEKSWINSKPLSLEKLKGNLILIDFWAYSCINCLRTLPALKQLWEKYKEKGLMIIGIHTPEFEFEKDLKNVKKAVKNKGINWPVANDPEGINWHNYGNTYWPRTALINGNGELIFEHVGESGYDEIEEKIINELQKMGEIKSDIKRIDETRRTYPLSLSRETYAGSLRNKGIGSSKVCTKERCDEYFDNGRYEKDTIYLQGDWLQTEEYLEFRGKDGWIALHYFASEVNAVMEGKGKAKLLVNDIPVSLKNAGADAVSGRINIKGADMYNLVKTMSPEEGVIKIIPFKGMRVYAYTFG